MSRKNAKEERTVQRIDEDLKTDLIQHPTQIKEYYSDNIIKRVISYLSGFTGDRTAVMLRASNTGALSVNEEKTALSNIRSTTLNVTANTTLTFDFQETQSLLRIHSSATLIRFSISMDGINFTHFVEIPSGTYHIFNLKYRFVRVFNTHAVTATDVRLEGFRP